MRNILILSCKVGEGHNTAAKALLERIEHEGHNARIVDFLGLSSDKASDILNDSYVRVAKHTPLLFGAIYHMGLSVSKHLHQGRSPIYWASSKVAPKLWELLQTEHFDAVMCTHLFPALALTHLKKQGYDIPTSIVVATDYACYPFLEETACDHYVLAHEDMTIEYAKRGIPPEKMLPYGIPVSMRFLNTPTREEAKRHLGLDADKKMYLIMGGSMGAGRLRGFSKKLCKSVEDAEIVVICGKNETLRRSLENRLSKNKNAHIIGFTNDIPLYMTACDVLYTKPGGLTSTEALVTKTPVVHTSPIPGCESDNVRFFGDNGLSLPAKSVRQQLRCGKLLVKDDALRQEMRRSQDRCAKPNASLDIFRLVEEKKESRV